MELRNYQKKGCDLCVNTLATKKHFRYEMTTGAGKTILAIETAKIVAGDKPIIVATHNNQMRNQFQIEVNKSKITNCKVYTYQALKNSKKNCYLLIADESHQGGQTLNGSYKKIIKSLKPTKIISLSATDYGVQNKLFGKEKFSFGLVEAFEEGVINQCNIITIDTGLVQTLSNGKQIEAKGLSELLDKDKKNGVKLKHKKSVENLMKTSILAIKDIYLAKEKGNQAIIYVPTIALADWAHKNLKGIKTAVSHSFIKDKNIFDQFKAKKFDVLITVHQGREGFDYPELEVVFDCAPSFTNNGRNFKQKCGRILRKIEGKKTSRYYILNRVNKYTKHLPSHLATRMAIAETSENDHKIEKINRDNILVPQELTDLYSEFFENNDYTKIPKELLEKKNCASALFVSKAEKNKIKKSYSLYHILKNSNMKNSNIKKQKLLEMAKKGLPKPKRADPLGLSYSGYTRKSSGSFDQNFVDKIRVANESWLQNSKEARKNAILFSIQKICRLKNKPKYNSPEYKLLYKRIELARSLRPDWFEEKLEYSSSIKKKKILIMAINNERIKSNNPLYGCMRRYIKKKGDSYDEFFHKKLNILAPESWKIPKP